MNNLIKHMSIYGIGGVLSKAAGVLLVPLYTRVLAPEDYGVLGLVYTAGSLLAIIYGFMISSGYVRNYYETNNLERRDTLLASALGFTIIISLALTFVSFLYADEIADSIFEFQSESLFFKLISISTAIFASSQIIYGLLQVSEESKKYILTNIISLLSTIALTIYFVVVLQQSVRGVLIAQLIGRSIEFSILSFLIIRKLTIRLSFRMIWEMLKYSLPLIPVQLAAFVIDLSDRFFLQEFSTLEQIGLYSLGYRVSTLILLFAVQPLKAFTPYIFSIIDNPQKTKKTLADFTRYYVFAILSITLLISMFSKEAISIVADKSYHSSWEIVFPITLAYGVYGVILLSSYAIEIVKMNWISSAFWVVGAFVNVVCNFLLIPDYGIWGAALATVISYSVVLVSYWIAIRTVYPVPFEYGRFLLLVILGLIVYYLSTFVDLGLGLTVMSKSGLLLMFFFIAIFGGYLSREEVRKGMKMLSSAYQSIRYD